MTSPRTDPWSVLGLPRGTSERGLVRRAYARQLRLHTPEDDPSGFRSVRDAYEVLNQSDPGYLRWLVECLEDLPDAGAENGEELEPARDGDLDLPAHDAAASHAAPTHTAAEPGTAPDPADTHKHPAQPAAGLAEPAQDKSADPPAPAPGWRAPAEPAPLELPPTAPPLTLPEPSPGVYSERPVREQPEPRPRPAPAPPSAPTPAPPVVLPEPPPEPPVLAPTWAAWLGKALTTRPGAAPDSTLVIAALRSVCHEALQSREGLDQLRALLRLDWPRHERIALAEAFPPEAYVELLRRDETETAQWVTQELVAAGAVESLARLARVAAATPENLGGGPSRDAIVELALHAALLAREAARLLLDAAWKQAPPAQRRRLPVDLLEERIAAGSDTKDWARGERELLAHALLPPGEAPPLTHADVRSLRELARSRLGTPLVLQVLERHRPELMRAESEEPRPAPIATPRPRNTPPAKTSIGLWPVLGLLAFVSWGVRACTLNRSHDAVVARHAPLKDTWRRDTFGSPADPVLPLSRDVRLRLQDLARRSLSGPRLTLEETWELQDALALLRRRLAAGEHMTAADRVTLRHLEGALVR